jgi:hypothetical protein
MKVTMLLCDHAQSADGKLNLLGGGWSVTGPQPSPFGIAILFQVPWDRANELHQFRLELLDADGRAFMIEGGPEGEQPVRVEGSFETGRPAGLRPGTPIDFPFAMNSGPLPLPPGSRFEWRLTVDDQTHDDWRLAFTTRPSEG